MKSIMKSAGFHEIRRISCIFQMSQGPMVLFFWVCQRAYPWCQFHLFRYDTLADHLIQLFFDLRFVLDWHLASSVLYWWYVRVGLDVVFT